MDRLELAEQLTRDTETRSDGAGENHRLVNVALVLTQIEIANELKRLNNILAHLLLSLDGKEIE